MGRFGLALLRVLAPWPLPWLRALGWVLGWLVYGLAVPRRRVAEANLALCFPRLPAAARARLVRRNMICYTQTWLDRAWLWHGDPAQVRRRLSLQGDLSVLAGDLPTVVFAPHFYGLDAGWTGLTQQLPRAFTTIYTPQRGRALNDWVLAGRQRFGRVRLFYRADGVKPIVSALREGEVLYLLPDMNFGPQESIFVPFYGVSAATVPSLSRFARLGRAQVVPVTTRMTPTGYAIEIHPAWTDFPTADAEADTALMNRRLQDLIDTMPEQYYWVHKRFKTRPAGDPPVYGRHG